MSSNLLKAKCLILGIAGIVTFIACSFCQFALAGGPEVASAASPYSLSVGLAGGASFP